MLLSKIRTMCLLLCAVCSTLGAGDFTIGAYISWNQDADFKAVKAAGVNLVVSYGCTIEENLTFLDLAEQNQMKALVTLDKKNIMDGKLDAIQEQILAAKDHPALGGWYLFDEPSVDSGVPPEKLKPIYEMLKKETPESPVYLGSAWTKGWTKYSPVTDIQIVDYYPVKNEKFPEAKLTLQTEFTQHALDLGKPAGTVIQTMSWANYPGWIDKTKYPLHTRRVPQKEEMRYIVFAPLAQGVVAIFAYSYTDASKTRIYDEQGKLLEKKDMWPTAFAPYLRDLRAFTDLLADPVKADVILPKDKTIPNYKQWFCARFAGKNEGEEYLIFVNSKPEPIKPFSLFAPQKFKGKYTLTPLLGTRDMKTTVGNSVIRFGEEIAPWEVLIWKAEHQN